MPRIEQETDIKSPALTPVADTGRTSATEDSLRATGSEPRAVAYKVGGFTAAVMALAISAQLPETRRFFDPSAVGEVFSFSKLRPALAPYLAPLAAEMESYRSLDAGWDGLGSIAPSFDAIDSALAFLRALPPTARPPESTVSADGSVGWFWKSPGRYITVNFPGGGRFSYYGSAQGIEARGAYAFDGESLPQDLLDVIALA